MIEQEISTKIVFCTFDELSEIEKNLIESAKSASMKAYAPYSKFNVGAALLLANDSIVTGNNQENAAYPSGLCAERTAVFYANAQYPDQPVVAIAVAAWNENGYLKEAIAPCGACRQVLLETENRYQTPVKVYLYGDQQIAILDSVKTLLPLSFGVESLFAK